MRALHAASEAHRLLSNAVHAGVGTSPALPSSASSSGAGWWALAAAYLGGLLLLGELFEAAGLADEAVQAYKEGGRLVSHDAFVQKLALMIRIEEGGQVGVGFCVGATCTRDNSSYSAWPV